MRWKSAKYHPTRKQCFENIFFVDIDGRCFTDRVSFENFGLRKEVCAVGNFTWKEFVEYKNIVKWQTYEKVDKVISKMLKVDYIDF